MSEEVTMSFPGLGIPEFTVNKVAFSIFGLDVRWYGILIATGVVLAFLYAWKRSKSEKIKFDDLLDITIFAVIFAMIGARTYYVLTTLGKGLYKSFIDVIAIWNGGIAIYGAIIGGAVAVFVTCKIKKISWQKAFDMASPAVMIGQIIGRWGNFFNGEAYGTEMMENSPLYFLRMGLIPNIESATKMFYFHPTFLYESLWNLTGFIIINALYKKKKFDGQVFLMYATWYGFGRMFVEGLRTDSLYVGIFRISQVVGFMCFIIGTGLLIYFLFAAKKKALAVAGDYQPVYPKLAKRKTASPSQTDKPDTEKTIVKDNADNPDGEPVERVEPDASADGEQVEQEKEPKNNASSASGSKRVKRLFGRNNGDNDNDGVDMYDALMKSKGKNDDKDGKNN